MEPSPYTLAFFMGVAVGFFGAIISLVLGMWFLGVMAKKKSGRKI